MVTIAEDFAPRVHALITHMKDPSQPKPEFAPAEKPVVQHVIAQMSAIDPSIKAAVELHNIREAAKTATSPADKQPSIWDNAGRIVAKVAALTVLRFV